MWYDDCTSIVLGKDSLPTVTIDRYMWTELLIVNLSVYLSHFALLSMSRTYIVMMWMLKRMINRWLLDVCWVTTSINHRYGDIYFAYSNILPPAEITISGYSNYDADKSISRVLNLTDWNVCPRVLFRYCVSSVLRWPLVSEYGLPMGSCIHVKKDQVAWFKIKEMLERSSPGPLELRALIQVYSVIRDWQ